MVGLPNNHVSLLFRRRIYQMDPTCLDDAELLPRIHFHHARRQPRLETSFFFIIFLYVYTFL
jgi:hypothetical protein